MGLARSHTVTYPHHHHMQVRSFPIYVAIIHTCGGQPILKLRWTSNINQVLHPVTAVDDAIRDHPLGDMNVSSRKQRSPSPHIDPDDSQFTEPICRHMSSRNADSLPTDFLSTCHLADAKTHFAQLPHLCTATPSPALLLETPSYLNRKPRSSRPSTTVLQRPGCARSQRSINYKAPRHGHAFLTGRLRIVRAHVRLCPPCTGRPCGVPRLGAT